MDIKKGESTLNIMLISIIIVIVVSIGIDSLKKNEININNEGKLTKNNENQQEILLSKGDISLKEEESIQIEIQKLQEILNNELFILVNQNNKLEADYEPSTLVEADIPFEDYIECKKLDKRANEAVKRMFDDALKENINMISVSGYRSYYVQQNLYNSRIKLKGLEKTRQYTAEPGASEHQTGLAIDITSKEYPYLDEEFENTNTFKWLINNCYKYGFILRYQRGKENITQYNYEPWHFRYIGNSDIAKEIMEREICFEEYIEEVKSKIERLSNKN